MAKKNDKKKKIILGIVVSIFLLSSIASVILYRNDDQLNQDTFKFNFSNKEYTFTRKIEDNAYFYEVNAKDDKFIAYFFPYEVSSIKYEKEAIQKIKNSQVFYLTFDPEDQDISSIDFIRFELAKYPAKGKYISEGILNFSNFYNLPIINCINATDFMPVVILRTSNETSIFSSENCININFVKFETLKIRDLLIYLTRGIDIK